MNNEELVIKINEIENKLTKFEMPAKNRFYLYCENSNSFDANKFLFEELGCRFVIATAIDNDDAMEILYHYSYDETGTVITIKSFIRDNDNPKTDSITPIIPGAEWIEREIHDVFGVGFKNHPNLERLILADDWPEGVYPERKEVQK